MTTSTSRCGAERFRSGRACSLVAPAGSRNQLPQERLGPTSPPAAQLSDLLLLARDNAAGELPDLRVATVGQDLAGHDDRAIVVCEQHVDKQEVKPLASGGGQGLQLRCGHHPHIPAAILTTVCMTDTA
jgi:hypothetical protein